MAGQQELKIERRKPSKPRLLEVLSVYLCFRVREQLVVVRPKSRPVQGNRFETLPVEIVRQFTGELVKPLKVPVEVVAPVVCPDEATVSHSFENPVDGVAVVITLLGDGSWLVEVTEHLERLARQ